MDAKGLQIGNYIQDIISGEWMIVDELGENIGATLINRDKYPLPDGWQMGPIPLTPEVLEKAGFVEAGAGYFGGKKMTFNQFSFDFAGGHLDLSECIEGNYVNRKNIKYVHQLQNLYFALTGEELKIEL